LIVAWINYVPYRRPVCLTRYFNSNIDYKADWWSWNLSKRRIQTQIGSLDCNCDLNIICEHYFTMNAVPDESNDSTNPTPNGNIISYEDQILDRLLHVPPGRHYLILYPNIETMLVLFTMTTKNMSNYQFW